MLERVRPGVALELCQWHHLGYLIRVSGGSVHARSARARRVGQADGEARDLVDALAPLAGTSQTIRVHDRVTKAERARMRDAARGTAARSSRRPTNR